MADIIPSSTFDNGYSKCMVGTFNGPAVYVTGGFVVNLQPTFSLIDWIEIGLETIVNTPRSATIERKRNVPVGGKVTIRLFTLLFPVLGMVELSELPSGTDVSGVTFTFAALGI